MTIGEYFMHKWLHVLYIMTSSIIPPLSILTTWIRGRLTALRLERSELNLIPIVRFRVARRINHQIFIKARLGAQLSIRTWVLLICVQNETFFHSFFSYERTSTRSCFDKAPEGKWKSEKDYCRSWTAPGLGGILYWVGVKLQFWRQGTCHVTSWRSRLAGNAKKLRS